MASTFDCSCNDAPASAVTPGEVSIQFPRVPEPTGNVRITHVGANDAVLLPGRSYRIPFAATGSPSYTGDATIAIPGEVETSRVYVHKAEVTADGFGVAVVTNLDTPVLASSVLNAAIPSVQSVDFTDVAEFIGDFSFGWLAIGAVLGIILLASVR